MVRIIRISFWVLFVVTLTTCTKMNTSISGEYGGYWLESKFTYKFFKNNKFSFLTDGHIGQSETEGKYIVKDSIIIINHPSADRNEVLQDRLLIKSNTCLRDYRSNIYCKNENHLDSLNEVRFKLESSVKKQLLNLSTVKEVIKKYTNYTKFHLFPRFEHDEIVLIDDKEYHVFRLERMTEKYNSNTPRITYPNQIYYIDFNKKVILRYDSKQDSLIYIENLN